MKKDRVGYETALAALVPGFISLAPARQDVRRAARVKAADTEFVWLMADGAATYALVSLADGSTIWAEGVGWKEHAHRPGTADWRGEHRCTICGGKIELVRAT